MDETNAIELRILEEIEQSGSFTQRDLSHKLSIALGLANAYLRRLVEKGYVMVSTMPRRRVFYNLTPKGIMEKSRLTALYMRDSVNYYRVLRESIGRTLQTLRDGGAQRVAILGTGEIAEIVYILLRQTDLELAAVIDLGARRAHFFGLEVFGLDRLAAAEYDAAVLAEDLGGDWSALTRLIAEQRIPVEKIVLFSGQRFRVVQQLELAAPGAGPTPGETP